VPCHKTNQNTDESDGLEDISFYNLSNAKRKKNDTIIECTLFIILTLKGSAPHDQGSHQNTPIIGLIGEFLFLYR